MKALIVALAGTAAIAMPAMAYDCGSKNTSAKAESTRYISNEAHVGNIVETAQAAGSFETLIAAAVAADLGGTLSEGGPLTVFAPTDAAFAELPHGTVDTLLKPENKAQLASILTYHVVPGEFKAEDLVGRISIFETVNGQTIEIDGREGVSVNDINVITADVEASNGVIHVIEGVLLPH